MKTNTAVQSEELTVQHAPSVMQLEQLPIITQQLSLIGEEIQGKISDALALACTDETVKFIKTLRTALSKDFQTMEEKRKAIKTAILAPYEQFEDVYRQFVSERYRGADTQLKERITSVEDRLKEQKRTEVLCYFTEYLASKGIDFVSFAQVGLNITLTASLKSLKEQCKAFVDRVFADLALIETQGHKAEILVEYRKSLDCSRSIVAVNDRHRAIDEEEAKAAAVTAAKEAQAVAAAKVEAAMPIPVPAMCAPKEIGAQEAAVPLGQLTFTVIAPVIKLKILKQFLNDGGYVYE